MASWTAIFPGTTARYIAYNAFGVYDLTLPEELVLLERSLSAFARLRLAPALRDHEDAGGLPDALADELRDLELAALDVPRSAGGAGLGPLAKVVALEALARVDAAAALALDGLGPAVAPLVEVGGARGIDVVRRARESGARGVVLIDDRAENVGVREHRAVGRWPWAPVPATGHHLIVLLEGPRVHVLGAGVALAPVPSLALQAAGSSELVIDAEVVATFEEPRGAARARARVRLYAAALLVGVGGASLGLAASYTQERVAFGRPVAHHQGVAFLLAELATRLDAARLTLHRAAWALEQDGDPTEAAAQAHMDAIDASLAAGEEGVQLLGGHGYMQDHPAEKWMREARTLSLLFGGRDAALDDLSERVLSMRSRASLDVAPWPRAEAS